MWLSSHKCIITGIITNQLLSYMSTYDHSADLLFPDFFKKHAGSGGARISTAFQYLTARLVAVVDYHLISSYLNSLH